VAVSRLSRRSAFAISAAAICSAEAIHAATQVKATKPNPLVIQIL
jgi:hypothetical protein